MSARISVDNTTSISFETTIEGLDRVKASIRTNDNLVDGSAAYFEFNGDGGTIDWNSGYIRIEGANASELQAPTPPWATITQILIKCEVYDETAASSGGYTVTIPTTFSGTNALVRNIVAGDEICLRYGTAIAVPANTVDIVIADNSAMNRLCKVMILGTLA